MCPRQCHVDRFSGEKGFCRAGRYARLASFNAHFGEEAPLVGRHGSGTIFFGLCNLMCSFCQNYEISHFEEGHEIKPQELAEIMIRLQEWGCHNINLVTPTQFTAQILESLPIAISMGLNLPLVYNCGGYENIDTLKTLEGVIDIYMPDFKFWNDNYSEQLCHAPDYAMFAREAVKEMHRQVGDLIINNQGVAERGLLLRHLVMPGSIAGTEFIMKFIAEQISKNTYVNVMDQYRPCGDAYNHQIIARRITRREYMEAIEAARNAGLHRLDSQEALNREISIM